MAKDTLQDGRIPGFYIIDNELLDNYGPSIGVYGIAVYNVLAKYANEKGANIFPSYQTIATALGMSRPKVIETIKQLVDVGLVRKTPRFDSAGDMTSNEYALVNLKGGKPQIPPSKQRIPPSKQNEPPVVNDVNQGGKQYLPDQDPSNKTQLEQEGEITCHQSETQLPAPTPPPPLLANEYLPGLPDPRKRNDKPAGAAENVMKAKKLGLDAEQFRLLVDALLDGFGQKPLADAGDDRVINHAQLVTLRVMGVSEKFRTPDGIASIFASWKENDYRGDTVPTSDQFKEHASLMASNKVVCNRKDKQPPAPKTFARNGNEASAPKLRNMNFLS